MNPEPFRIDPTFSPRLWGSRSLAPIFPDKTNLEEPLGEAWLTDVNCLIATGRFAGKTLAEAWREMPSDWRGTNFSGPGDFPLLVKFIFPVEKLSIQVHPDDEYAALHEQAAGGRGKTEMWHIVSAKPGASLLLGLKPGATKDSFLEALNNHSLEDLFQRHPVNAGDTFFVSARTAHTIGPNMVICEVQEYSDLTYRVYDYGRLDPSGKPRELHVEKALDVMNFGESLGGKVPPVPMPLQRGRRYLLSACPYFATERWEVAGLCDCCSNKAQFELLVFLAGNGGLRWVGGEASYKAGDCWLIPANLDAFVLQPLRETSIIRTCVPNLAAARKQWQNAGIPESSLAAAIFD